MPFLTRPPGRVSMSVDSSLIELFVRTLSKRSRAELLLLLSFYLWRKVKEMRSENFLQSLGRNGVKRGGPRAVTPLARCIFLICGRVILKISIWERFRLRNIRTRLFVHLSMIQSLYNMSFKRNMTLFCCHRLVKSGDIGITWNHRISAPERLKMHLIELIHLQDRKIEDQRKNKSWPT